MYDVIVNGKQNPIRILRLLWKCLKLQRRNKSPGHSGQCLTVKSFSCDTPAVQNSSWKEYSKQKHDCEYTDLAIADFTVMVETKFRQEYCSEIMVSLEGYKNLFTIIWLAFEPFCFSVVHVL
jgi:hypothetical protein